MSKHKQLEHRVGKNKITRIQKREGGPCKRKTACEVIMIESLVDPSPNGR